MLEFILMDGEMAVKATLVRKHRQFLFNFKGK